MPIWRRVLNIDPPFHASPPIAPLHWLAVQPPWHEAKPTLWADHELEAKDEVQGTSVRLAFAHCCCV